MNCYYCAAKARCPSYVQPGSVFCIVNQMQTGSTHADDPPSVPQAGYCQFCGRPLKIVGRQRYCNNPRCSHRYEQV